MTWLRVRRVTTRLAMTSVTFAARASAGIPPPARAGREGSTTNRWARRSAAKPARTVERRYPVRSATRAGSVPGSADRSLPRWRRPGQIPGVPTCFASPSPLRAPFPPPEEFPPARSSSGTLTNRCSRRVSRPEPLTFGRMEPSPSSWSRPEPPAAPGGQSGLSSSPPVQPARPEEPGPPAESAVTDLLASLFSPAPPARPEPSFSFSAPVETPPSMPEIRPEPSPAVAVESPPVPEVRPEPSPAAVSEAPAVSAAHADNTYSIGHPSYLDRAGCPRP